MSGATFSTVNAEILHVIKVFISSTMFSATRIDIKGFFFYVCPYKGPNLKCISIELRFIKWMR